MTFTASDLARLQRRGHRVISETGARDLTPCCGASVGTGPDGPVCLACGRRVAGPESGARGRAGAGGRRVTGPTVTEQRYFDEVLVGRLDGGLYRRVVFHGLRLYMGNTHIYTPDWCAVRKDGQIELHEVKGSYRLGSFQRSRLAFDQARVEWPEFIWVWAEKTYDGWANDWEP